MTRHTAPPPADGSDPAPGAAALAAVRAAIADIAAGALVLVVDDEDRENEGDLCCAAELVTPGQIAFMARHASGLICTPMTAERLDELELGPAVADNTSPHGTAFTVSVEARDGTTTGISAQDRAVTIRRLVDPTSRPSDFVRPGHTFPLRAVPGGVLEREGHTEAGVDLARLAGLRPAAVICEIMNDDGTMARGPELRAFAQRHGIRMISVAALAAYRRRTERVLVESARCRMPIGEDVWETIAYVDANTGETHLALVLGDVDGAHPVLVHAHACCLTGDVFRSRRCDCRHQLDASLQRMSRAGRGVVLYLDNDTGRGLALIEKLKQYESRRDLARSPDRSVHEPLGPTHYRVAASILIELGITDIRLLTNNPSGSADLNAHGIRVAERAALRLIPGGHAGDVPALAGAVARAHTALSHMS